MRHRDFGVQGESLLELRDGFVLKLLAQHHLPQNEVRLGALGRRRERAREGRASLVVLVGLKVTDPEQVGAVDVGPRHPGLYVLEQGNGLLQVSELEVGKSQQLSRFAVVRFLLQGRFEMRGGLHVIALLIIRLAQLGFEAWGLGRSPRDPIEQRDRLIVLALVDQGLRLRQGRIGGRSRRGLGSRSDGGGEKARSQEDRRQFWSH